MEKGRGRKQRGRMVSKEKKSLTKTSRSRSSSRDRGNGRAAQKHVNKADASGLEKSLGKSLEEHSMFKLVSGGVSPGFIQRLMEMSVTRVYLPGDVIVRKGEVGRGMFFIAKGTLEVVSESGETVFDTIGAGQFFGEVGVLFSVPRTATVRASKRSVLLMTPKEQLETVLKDFPEVDQVVRREAEERFELFKKRQRAAQKPSSEDTVKFQAGFLKRQLQEVPLFRDAEIGFLHMLALSLEPVVYQTGDVIVELGEPAREMYFIVSGFVEVIHNDGSVLAIMREGKFFGEVGVLLGVPRTARVRAGMQSELFVLTAERLKSILPKYPEVAEKVKEAAEERYEYFRSDVTRQYGLLYLCGVGGSESAGHLVGGEFVVEINRETLSRVDLFRKCDVGQLHTLSLALTHKAYQAGEYIIEKGQMSKEMYFILRGVVEVVSSDGTVVHDTMEAGDCFGEIGLLFSIPRTVSVRAKDLTNLFVISKARLWEVIKQYPEMGKEVEKIGRKRYRLFQERDGIVKRDLPGGEEADDEDELEIDEDARSVHDMDFLDRTSMSPVSWEKNQVIQQPSLGAIPMEIDRKEDAQVLMRPSASSVKRLRKLPVAVIIKVFQYLPIQDLLHAAATCRVWYRASMHRSLWERVDMSPVHKVVNDEVIDWLGTRAGENLTHLRLRNCWSVTDSALDSMFMKCHNIVWIDLHGLWHMTSTSVWSLGLNTLKLTQLNLTNCKSVCDVGIMHLSEGCTNLTHLYLGFCKRITDVSLEAICRRLHRIRHLNFNRCIHLTDVGFFNMSHGRLSRLHSLVITDCTALTDFALECVAKGCRDLRHLNVQFCTGLTDAVMFHIGGLERLENLCIAYCPNAVTDAGVRSVVLNCRRLRRLSVRQSLFVSDASIQLMSEQASNLVWLDVAYCRKISRRALELFNERRPTVHVVSTPVPPKSIPTDLRLAPASPVFLKNPLINLGRGQRRRSGRLPALKPLYQVAVSSGVDVLGNKYVGRGTPPRPETEMLTASTADDEREQQMRHARKRERRARRRKLHGKVRVSMSDSESSGSDDEEGKQGKGDVPWWKGGARWGRKGGK